MSKYFDECKDFNELRKKYLSLSLEYHPDLTNDEEEKTRRHDIFCEINNEYSMLSKILPKVSKSANFEEGIYSHIVNGSMRASEACAKIDSDIYKPNIDFKYYNSLEGVRWWEEEILKEIDATVKSFWDVCYCKKIIGDEFAKLFELCGYNAEKIKRVVMFLSTGIIAEKDMHTNLTSDNAISFLSDEVSMEGLPDYDSFLLLSKDNTKQETFLAWVEFCQKQRDCFYDKYYEIVVPKVTTGKQI